MRFLQTFYYLYFPKCLITKLDLYLMNKNYINKELYIANNINNLLRRDLKVKYLEADFWINLGDVHDFHTYIYWQNFLSETNYIKL